MPVDYDIIIDINSMKPLLDMGWEIFKTQRYEEKKDIASVLISVFGNHNTGKSFILSKISGINLPYGYSISTKGLSTKYLDNQNIVLLDSFGLNQSLVQNEVYKLSKSKDELSEKEYIDEVTDFANDRFITEHFILNFILFYSNIPILVLEELSFPEQQLYDKATKLLYGNQLFIIHNLKNCRTIEQVKDYITDNLKNSIIFNVNQNNMIGFEGEILNNANNIYYLEEINNEYSNKNIIHLIMAKDNTEAGNYYNQSTIHFLRQRINTCYNIQKFPIEEKIKEYIFKTSKTLMKTPIQNINQIIIENDFVRLNVEEGYEIKFKKFDEIILYESLFGEGYKPKQYDYYIAKDKENKSLKLYIELFMNGTVRGLKVKVSLLKNNYIFNIFGQKIINEDEKLDFSNRFEGYFNYELKIPSSEIELADYKVKNKSHFYGIITLEFDLIDNNKNESQDLGDFLD